MIDRHEMFYLARYQKNDFNDFYIIPKSVITYFNNDHQFQNYELTGPFITRNGVITQILNIMALDTEINNINVHTYEIIGI